MSVQDLATAGTKNVTSPRSYEALTWLLKSHLIAYLLTFLFASGLPFLEQASAAPRCELLFDSRVGAASDSLPLSPASIPAISVSQGFGLRMKALAVKSRISGIFKSREQRARPLLAHRVAELPGVVLLIFDNLEAMNHSLLRASSFVEQKKVRSDHELRELSLKIQGHNLRGRDILRYWQMVGERTIMTAETTDNRDLQQTERRFWSNFLLPMVTADPDLVVIATSLGSHTLSVASHEIIHAQFFLDPRFRGVVQDVWRNRLTERQRGEVRKFLGRIYDANDEELMMNEFTAYVLMRDPKLLTNESGAVFRAAFKKALVDAGSPILEVK